MKTANETLITCLQIETQAGVDNIDAICAVPGVGKCSQDISIILQVFVSAFSLTVLQI